MSTITQALPPAAGKVPVVVLVWYSKSVFLVIEKEDGDE